MHGALTKELLDTTMPLECSWHIVVPTIVGFDSLRNGVKCNCVIPVGGDCMYATMVHDNSLWRKNMYKLNKLRKLRIALRETTQRHLTQ